ncbi:MAG TPA: YtxH domain-containing protein [Oligoflexus sp.]|uniref:YtxH domain-containing protein n=1 Tax=Oligoflexus sp. TaxID=1971216 RepID=UPI002D7E4A2E|nr:YtxH domain-containing protein [Oligoflexus sp.]HET9236608.1 YtxH domain-containing protein [Oligoflexus sp.]
MFSLKNISNLKDEINMDAVAQLGEKVKDMSGRVRYMGDNRLLKNTGWLLAGAAIGSLLSHFLDPQEGQRRRTEIKDKALSMGKTVQDATRRRFEDLNSRVRGAASDAQDAIQAGMEKRA